MTSPTEALLEGQSEPVYEGLLVCHLTSGYKVPGSKITRCFMSQFFLSLHNYSLDLLHCHSWQWICFSGGELAILHLQEKKKQSSLWTPKPNLFLMTAVHGNHIQVNNYRHQQDSPNQDVANFRCSHSEIFLAVHVCVLVYALSRFIIHFSKILTLYSVCNEFWRYRW